VTAYENLLRQESEKRRDEFGNSNSAGPRLGDVVIEADKVNKAYGDNLLVERYDVCAAAGRYRRCDWAERSREDNSLPHDHEAGEGGQREDPHRRHRAVGLCRSKPHARRR